MEGIRRRGVSALALSSALLGLPLAARADLGIRDIQVRRESNLTSVAVQAIVSGDDDSSAVLRIFQKSAAGSAYDTGMVMVRRVGTRIHEARILWLKPDRLVAFFIEGRDANGDFSTPAYAARVLPVRGTVVNGPVFFVDQGLGNDSFDGRSPGVVGGGHGPTRTIGAALQRLAASPDSGSGGGVLVAPGEYHERLDLTLADGGPRFLVGDGRNPDSTILCGANPWVERGQWAPGQPLVWTFLGDSVWATPFPARTPGSSPGDSTQLVVLGWGEYLHRKTSLRGLLADSTWAGVPESTNEGERSGWFWQNDSLYVKRANGGSPVGLVLHTGYLDALVNVRGRNWRIADLTIRFAGGVTDDPGHPANPDPGLHGHGIVAGLNGTASGLVVDHCRIYGHNSSAIYVVHGANGSRADSVTVTRCTVDGLTVGRMAYGAGKGRAEEDVGEIRILSRAANVNNNVITGGFDGIQIGPGDAVRGAADSTWGSQVEIAYNSISHLADDAIELDTSHAINTLVLGNTITDMGHGVSQTPIFTGPVFVLFNTIADARGAGIKLGGGTTGIVWYVHNTVASSHVNAWALDSPGGPVDHVHFRNNVLAARGGYWGYTVWGPTWASRTTNDFNYDLLDSVRTLRLVNWAGTAYSLADLRSALGWETNGLQGAPQFSDSAAKNWSLLPTTPGRGRGMRITGINSSADGPFGGTVPDIGATVLPALAMAPLRPVAIPVLRARALPNPARGDGVVELLLPHDTEVTLQMFDVQGRLAATLLDHAKRSAGDHRIRIPRGVLAPGVYLYRVRTGEGHVEGRVVLLP